MDIVWLSCFLEHSLNLLSSDHDWYRLETSRCPTYSLVEVEASDLSLSIDA